MADRLLWYMACCYQYPGHSPLLRRFPKWHRYVPLPVRNTIGRLCLHLQSQRNSSRGCKVSSGSDLFVAGRETHQSIIRLDYRLRLAGHCDQHHVFDGDSNSRPDHLKL
jgi:hypothetical protein